MRVVALLVFFLFPFSSFASVVISEVMYDLEGTDTDREWLEIHNNGSDSVNLTGWKFYENNANHGLELETGSEVLGPGEFAVIVDSPEKFLVDWPSFSGSLFDSSWSSFSNTGESFSIKNDDGDIVDSVTYTSEDGANGDGNSLQLIGGEFLPASPTPGAENQTSQEEVIDTTETENTSSSNVVEGTQVVHESTFGIPKRVIAGEKIKFKPKLYDNEGDLLFKELFLWSFGDGATREDEYRKDFEYTYEYPGTYVVYVEVYENGRIKDEPDHVFRQTVHVSSASVTLSVVDDSISVKNKSIYELDLGKWDLVIGNNSFRIPLNTIVLPGKEIRFSKYVLGVSGIDSVVLQNEMDTVVATVNAPEPEPAKIQTRTIYVPATPEPEPVEKIVEEVSVETETQLASASDALPVKNNNSLWILIYAALVCGVVGFVGYMYFKKEDDFFEEESEVDQYTFVE